MAGYAKSLAIGENIGVPRFLSRYVMGMPSWAQFRIAPSTMTTRRAGTLASPAGPPPAITPCGFSKSHLKLLALIYTALGIIANIISKISPTITGHPGRIAAW